MHPLLKGAMIGFSIAAPVGPIGLLCLRRSLAEGRWVGFASGLGAATADTIYGMVAAAGMTALTDALVTHQMWLRLGGGVFLTALGMHTLRSTPAAEPANLPNGRTLLSAYMSVFVLTLANPMTVLAFVGIFAALNFTPAPVTSLGPWYLVAGVFLGSSAWWLTLSSLASWMGPRIGATPFRLINIVAGSLICALGGWQIYVVVQSLR